MVAGALKKMKFYGVSDDEYDQYYNASSARFKRNRAKGPNPLSSRRKKKNKSSSTGNTDNSNGGGADAQPKKKRPRRKPATERHPQAD